MENYCYFYIDLQSTLPTDKNGTWWIVHSSCFSTSTGKKKGLAIPRNFLVFSRGITFFSSFLTRNQKPRKMPCLHITYILRTIVDWKLLEKRCHGAKFLRDINIYFGVSCPHSTVYRSRLQIWNSIPILHLFTFCICRGGPIWIITKAAWCLNRIHYWFDQALHMFHNLLVCK